MENDAEQTAEFNSILRCNAIIFEIDPFHLYY